MNEQVFVAILVSRAGNVTTSIYHDETWLREHAKRDNDIIVKMNFSIDVSSVNNDCFADLDKLDEMVKASFSRFLQAKEGDTVIATYRFDNSVMPEWLRQYSDHYFNRVIEFKY